MSRRAKASLKKGDIIAAIGGCAATGWTIWLA